jgi:hypothetical protein
MHQISKQVDKVKLLRGRKFWDTHHGKFKGANNEKFGLQIQDFNTKRQIKFHKI